MSNKPEKKSSGAPAWMVTFSDLMSLLLTFFILLYSMSDIDSDKFRDISQSIQGVFSGSGKTEIFDKEASIIDEMENPLESEEVESGLVKIHNKVSDYIDEHNLGKEVSVNMNEKGVFVDIKEAILFDPGSAKIKPGGIDVLKKLTGLLKSMTNEIVVEGHTDNVPIGRANYGSNWELSADRAVSVVRHFSEIENIDPSRLSAVGYSEFRPIADNTTAENKALNRRVNILIILDESEGED